MVAGCGEDDDGGVVGAGGSGSPADGDVTPAALDITVTHGDEGGAVERASLRCDGTATTGDGWLGGDRAAAACRALADPAVLAALEPPPVDQVCAEIYGGPSVATITGTVDGAGVDAVVDRRNGCGIARWDALAALLPEPSGP